MSGETFFEANYSYHVEYRYSYGGISRFFREIVENEKLYGTRCPSCHKTWVPPKADCAACRTKTEWVPLSGEGTVISATYCYHLPAAHPLHQIIDIPYILGLVQLDGTDSWLLTLIHEDEMLLNRVKPGDRVRVAFRERREGKLTDFYFVPIRELESERPR